MMGTAGSLGGVLFSQALGVLIGAFGYSSAFLVTAVMHPVAATVLVLVRDNKNPIETVTHLRID